MISLLAAIICAIKFENVIPLTAVIVIQEAIYMMDIPRLQNKLQYYFEQAQAADFQEEAVEGKNSRDKANWMIRKLEYYGWIEIDTDKSYVQRVSFKEYDVKIIRTLIDIAEGKQIEYQGYIYTIYSMVRSNTENHGIVLMSIVENADMLITGLKNLNSSIKHYIDELTKYKTPAEIMDVLFNDYIENMVDKRDLFITYICIFCIYVE